MNTEEIADYLDKHQELSPVFDDHENVIGFITGIRSFNKEELDAFLEPEQ